MQGNAPGPWHQRGFALVSEVLAKAGLPADTLERTGLLYEWEPYRTRWACERLSLTAKKHVFAWGESPSPYVVKRGHEEAFIALVQSIQNGKERVQRYGDHIAAMRAYSDKKRDDRAARHAAMKAFTTAQQLQPSRAEQDQAAQFLERWLSVDQDKVLYANSVQSLLEPALGAGHRMRIIAKLKPQYFLERLYGGNDPYSGLWLFQRALDDQRIVVRMALFHPEQGAPRCEAFSQVLPGREIQVPAPPSNLRLNGTVTMRHLNVGNQRIPVWLVGEEDEASGSIYTTAASDALASVRVHHRLRALRDLPAPEDFVRFREQYGSIHTAIKAEHLDAVLDWPSGRWTELERGGMATEEEAKMMSRLDAPRWLYEELERRYPDKYAVEEPGQFTSGRRKGLGMWDWKAERMFLNDAPPDGTSGFARRDLVWIGSLANMLAYNLSPVLKDFWSLLFLCDMKHYQTHGRGFTGIRYKATAKGPLATDADAVLDRLRKQEVIRVARTKYKGVQAQRVFAHPYYYPNDLTSHWRAGELLEALALERDKWDPGMVLRACQRVPQWADLVEQGALIPYDMAFSMEV